MEGSFCFVSTKEGVIPCTLGRKKKKPPQQKKPHNITGCWEMWFWYSHAETFARNYLLPHLPANSLPCCQDISRKICLFTVNKKPCPRRGPYLLRKDWPCYQLKVPVFVPMEMENTAFLCRWNHLVPWCFRSRVFGLCKPCAAPTRSRTSE